MTPLSHAVRRADGDLVALGRVGVHFKVDGDRTGGAFAIVEHPIEPGWLCEPHLHHREDELSYVLEGEVGFRIGEEELIAGPGDYVLKPRGIMHTFWNSRPGPARVLEIIWPPDFTGFFRDAAGLDPTATEQWEDLAARYGLEFDFDWVDDLSTRHGVTIDMEG